MNYKVEGFLKFHSNSNPAVNLLIADYELKKHDISILLDYICLKIDIPEGRGLSNLVIYNADNMQILIAFDIAKFNMTVTYSIHDRYRGMFFPIPESMQKESCNSIW